MRVQPSVLLAFATTPIGVTTSAQQRTSVGFDPQQGLLFKVHSTFALNFRFRMKDRASFYHTAGAGAEENTSQFRVRRFRLRQEGHAPSAVATRYSMVRYAAQVKEQYADRDEATIGYSYYLNGPRIKLRSALTYNWLDREIDTRQPGNQWARMLQVEFGI